MTPQPQHCEHECVCCDYPDDIAPKQRCPRKGCQHDTRTSRPAPSPELIDSTKGMEQKSETKSPDGRYHLCRSDASRHTCINVDEIRKEAAAQAREKVLDVFSEVEYLHDVDGITYPDLYNEFIQRYKSLRTGGEPR